MIADKMMGTTNEVAELKAKIKKPPQINFNGVVDLNKPNYHEGMNFTPDKAKFYEMNIITNAY